MTDDAIAIQGTLGECLAAQSIRVRRTKVKQRAP